MVQLLKTDKPDLFAVMLADSLSGEDYNRIVPPMEAKIAQHGKINLYWEMVDFDGWQPEGLWKDLKFDVKHINSFHKVAMVGEKKWQDWLTQLTKPFTPAEVRYFDLSQREEAMRWVNE